jgi:hypothetical protein
VLNDEAIMFALLVASLLLASTALTGMFGVIVIAPEPEMNHSIPWLCV